MHLYFALTGDDECSASLGSARADDDDDRTRISDATFIVARGVQFSQVQQQQEQEESYPCDQRPSAKLSDNQHRAIKRIALDSVVSEVETDTDPQQTTRGQMTGRLQRSHLQCCFGQCNYYCNIFWNRNRGRSHDFHF